MARISSLMCALSLSPACFLYVLLAGISDLCIEPYDEDQGTGELRYVQVINFVNK